MRLIQTSVLLAALSATPAIAGDIPFSSGWSEQRLSLFSSNDYSFGSQLSMVSDGAVSIAWTRIGPENWGAQSASWNWRVDASVPATDLARKGGDDRNLSIYFIFVPEAEAQGLVGANIRALRGRKDVRVLQYVWGGDYARGTMIPSPYIAGSAMIMKRAAGTGSHSESVNLASDYGRAFGGSSGALVGMAVSGDSDDTDSVIRAAISGMSVR